ncbi:hypothetical protein WG78_19735 [Amantichitinum ursilacus]|uniref:Uncharacterized protein n=1 Tax=Amantichitinum ursilacus TaxID=857265 RepID=A0A0N1JRU1_9NEIS|nr:hypothetical protein WG78_19735 [Amantichitinum ursilacus]
MLAVKYDTCGNDTSGNSSLNCLWTLSLVHEVINCRFGKSLVAFPGLFAR